ncbi:methyltransferase-like protein 7A [Esox lucius]|uniref:Methyltransferase type 11 domain-containing protein n=1 Tax=Esox lucius TaxID=8010 RepID=A0A3P8YU08_ESOLU|nr:methyltransferase-like protein 7A [Esox lucius]
MTICMHFFTLIVKVLTLPLKLMEAVGMYGIYKRFFPFVIYKLSASYNVKMKEKKMDLFSNLSDFKGNRPLRILEIGCGTGANFEFFPPGSSVICVDPNPHFKKYLQKSMSVNDHITFESFVVAAAEDMGAMKDNSMDVIVSTLVLCSVDDTPRTLREAHRILRPGGAFYFLEHVVADPSSWTYFFQHVLQPLWYYFGDGCELIRATWKDLEAAGFSELKLRHISTPLSYLVKPHVMGYAVK